ncbi:radical SAM protein [Eubacterium sp. MSJ-21]|nr:radical SAM protein [Eubacterium sp. MSJ-21]
MRHEKWLDKPYYSLDAYMKYTYGQKVYKIAVDAGLTCPNRDGTLGERGCIFCSAGGSGDFAVPIVGGNRQDGQKAVGASTEVYHKEYERRGSCGDVERKTLDVRRQMERGMAKFHKKVGEKFVIYFQAYTNTYGDPAYLERIWREALEEESVVGISIATRPDCLGIPGVSISEKHVEPIAGDRRQGTESSETVIGILARLKKEYATRGKFIWIELGLQTMHEKTAEYIRRGYPLSTYETAIRALTDMDIPYITHVILGLPGENEADMLATVRYVCGQQAKPFGIKLQLLHVLRGTDLYEDYATGKFEVLSEDEYIELVIRCLEIIPDDIVIHRVTGDGPKNILVAPLWSGNKRHVLNTLHQKMKIEKREQGTWAK